MKTMAVGKLKASFAEVLRDVQAGESVAVEFGRKHVPVAVIIPYGQYRRNTPRVLGVMEGRAKCVVSKDWELSDAEFLAS